MPEVMRDDLADAMSDPMPSMTDVMAQTRADFESVAVDKQVTRIDDYRHGPVLSVPDRPELDVMHLRDLGVR